MRKLISLFLLSAALSFGSVVNYTIDFYNADGTPVIDPASVNVYAFSYDASAPVGSQFTGFYFTWDDSDIDLPLIDSATQIQSFGEALILNACQSLTWSAYEHLYIGSDDFRLVCNNNNQPNTPDLSGTFTPGPLAFDESVAGIFTVCEVGTTCVAPASTPEPATICLVLTAAAMTLLSKPFVRKRSSRAGHADD